MASTSQGSLKHVMKKFHEIEQADRELRIATERCTAIKVHMMHLEKEIFSLNLQRLHLEENLAILKDTRTIALVSEFKRSKEELMKIETRLSFLKLDKINHDKMLARADKLFQECRDRVLNLLSEPVGKVIQGKFGNKNGGQE